MNEIIQKVSKLDVARRQLREAILLFFERRDPIAIHTLAAAAHQILHDLGRAKGGLSAIKDNPYIRPEKRKEFIAIIHAAQNFSKHADRDPNEEFEFRLAFTPLYIFDAVQMWNALTDKLFKEAFIFYMWFGIKNPHLIANQSAKAIFETFGQQLSENVDDFSAIRQAIDSFEFDD
jgi:hypothetical protein